MAHDDELNPQAIQTALQSFDDSISGIQGVGLGIKILLQKAKDLQEKQGQVQPEGDSQNENSLNITIQVGRSMIYKGPADGSGEFSITPQQDEQVTKALNNPSESNSSIKVLDSDRKPMLQITRTGEVVKDDLGAIAQAESVKQGLGLDLDFSQGEIPQNLGIPELNGVDPSKIASFDKDLAISWGYDLGMINSINENRRTVGISGTFPNEARELQSLQDTRESLMKQIKDKGYTNEQLLKVAGYSQSQEQPIQKEQKTDSPTLDTAMGEAQMEVATHQQSEQTSSVDEPNQSPVGKVLNVIDNAPGLLPIDQAVQVREPSSPKISKDEQIEQLKAQLKETRESFEELSKRIDTLTDRMENLSPIKLAKEQVNSWINKQRNSLALAIRTGAERLANGIERHDQSVTKLSSDVNETVQKIRDGMERHNQAMQTTTDKFVEVRDKVSQNYNTAAQFVGNKVEQAQQTRDQVVSSAQYQKGKEFLESVVHPAVRGVISQLEKVGRIELSADGTRTLDSETISWQLTKDGKVTMIDKSTGTQITPENLNQETLNTIKKFAAVAQQKGYVESQTQTQTQSQAVNQPKQVQSETQTQTLKV